MPVGKLSISRGRELGLAASASPRLTLVAPSSREPPPPAVTPAYRETHDRLAALERLACLFDRGALSPAEFAAEKALLLRADPASGVERAPTPAEPAAPLGPSLLARLSVSRILLLGLPAGLAFSFATQPRETIGFFDEALRLLGI